MRRLVGLFALGLLLVASPPQLHSQVAGDALSFFKNYFLTGDYVVAGTGLRGLGGLNGSPAGIATGTITVSDVPPNAEVTAAFLYWQVVSKSSLGPDSGALNATFDGFLLSTADGPVSKVLNSDGTSACWSAGGGTSGGGIIKTYTYRADVRRFLPVDSAGRFIVNTTHTVQVPDSGPSGNSVPIALGASLLVVYRDPTAPFNAVVIYDGGYTMDQNHDSMTQTIRGFYQAANQTGKITHIVGSGQLNKSENLHLPGLADDAPYTNQSVIVNPFTAAANANWDNPTYSLHSVNVLPAGQYGDSVSTSVDHVGLANNSFDCLTWGAVVYRTAVQDTDGDGLLDFWEEAGTHTDPNGHVLPNLNGMLANKMHKDVFVEIGHMLTTVTTPYGGVSKPAHDHMPVAAAIKAAGDAYKNAPVTNPDFTNGINAHFDVGDPANYHALGSAYQATGEGEGVDDYLVSSTYARGGEAINESVTACAWPDCEFPNHPGTVGWKVGFKYYRDQLVSQNPPALTSTGDDPCDFESVSPGNDDGAGGQCERRFDRNRNQMFRYVLGAHFIGLPKSDFPCVDAAGAPVAAQSDGTCAVGDNPDFHTPRTVSGVGDFPGADILMTLGGFDDAAGRPIGTPFMQGATLMHELGHAFDLSHAGVFQPGVTPEPNCKPNYLSVMNYLFQLRGLYKNDNTARMDYSREVLGLIPENPITNPFSFQLAVPSATPTYQTGWYAPKSSFTVGSAATKHCDGTPLSETEAAAVAAGGGMVRVDGPGVVGGSIDWDLNPGTVTSPQDLNFNGATASLNAGSNDWLTLRLNQLATRRNVLGLSTDVGRDGLGKGETLGRDGLGRDGLGRDGLGRDGLGRDGLGRDGLGRDGLGRDGLGRDGLGRDGLGADEVDDNLAGASGYAPPNKLAAFVQGGTGSTCAAPYGAPADCHRIQLTWEVPNGGSVNRYLVQRYRTDDANQAKTDVGQVPVTQGSGQIAYSFTDPTELLDGVNYTFIVTAEFIDNDNNTATPPPQSGRSIAITAVNIAPVAVADPPVSAPNSYTVFTGSTLPITTCAAFAQRKGVLCNDTDVDSAALSATLLSLPSAGTLTWSPNGTPVALQVNDVFDGSFTYTPPSNISGTVLTVTFTYKANDHGIDPRRSSALPATVTITIKKKSK